MTLLAQVTIPMDSALPEDVVVNTFHFMGVDDVPSMCTAIFTRLVAFYKSTVFTGGLALTDFMSQALNTTGTRLKIYNLEDSEPRVPVFDQSMGLLTTATSLPMPEEVALCLSYRGALVSGTNPARRRGRIYLGPFSTVGTINSGGDQARSRPSSTLISGIALIGKNLADASTVGVQWMVHSRASGGTNTPVKAGWVDNAWDTQRRRGPRPSTRTNWTGGLG